MIAPEDIKGQKLKEILQIFEAQRDIAYNAMSVKDEGLKTLNARLAYLCTKGIEKCELVKRVWFEINNMGIQPHLRGAKKAAGFQLRDTQKDIVALMVAVGQQRGKIARYGKE